MNLETFINIINDCSTSAVYQRVPHHSGSICSGRLVHDVLITFFSSYLKILVAICDRLSSGLIKVFDENLTQINSFQAHNSDTSIVLDNCQKGNVLTTSNDARVKNMECDIHEQLEIDSNIHIIR